MIVNKRDNNTKITHFIFYDLDNYCTKCLYQFIL